MKVLTFFVLLFVFLGTASLNILHEPDCIALVVDARNMGHNIVHTLKLNDNNTGLVAYRSPKEKGGELTVAPKEVMDILMDRGRMSALIEAAIGRCRERRGEEVSPRIDYLIGKIAAPAKEAEDLRQETDTPMFYRREKHYSMTEQSKPDFMRLALSFSFALCGQSEARLCQRNALVTAVLSIF